MSDIEHDFRENQLSALGRPSVTPELVDYYVRRGQRLRAQILRRGGRRLWAAVLAGFGRRPGAGRLSTRPAH